MTTYYGFTLTEWANAKAEMRQQLIARVKRSDTISYSELVARIQTIRLEPDSHALAAMLGEISTEEHKAGRGMLSVIVVHKDGDRQPGPGFFELARQLGRNTSDKMACWIQELNGVYAYWSKAT